MRENAMRIRAQGPISRLSSALLALLMAALFAARAAVAEEKASHQVSPFAGSLSYSIPIEVPAFHGIEPRLSLSYSSEGRNGFVGVGWTLTGVSTIERVNAGRGAAFFDASDVYLLDGQKLVACQAGRIGGELLRKSPFNRLPFVKDGHIILRNVGPL
jgi:hypothetical protein